MFYICFDFNLQKFRKYTVKIKSIPFAVPPRCLISRFIFVLPKSISTYQENYALPDHGCLFLVIAILLRLAVWWSTFGSIHCRAFAECEPFGLLPSDTWTNVKTLGILSHHLRFGIWIPTTYPKHRTSGGMKGCLKNVTNISVEISCKCYDAIWYCEWLKFQVPDCFAGWHVKIHDNSPSISIVRLACPYVFITFVFAYSLSFWCHFLGVIAFSTTYGLGPWVTTLNSELKLGKWVDEQSVRWNW